MANDQTPPKTLVFSFDGTGNEPRDAREFKNDESVSNILKLHILLGGGIQEDRSDTETPQNNSQITYYYNGIGTREGGRQIIVMNGSGACLPYNAMRLFWNNHRSMGDLS